MDSATILYYIFSATSIIYIAHLGYYLVGASLYDIWQHHRKHRLLKQDADEYLPTMTVLVPAHNEELVIARCLDSIFANSYPYVDVIVTNDASYDGTRRVLTQYRRFHPEARLRVINKRINAGKGASLNYALKHYVKSELVMMLDADSVLSPVAIERAVSYFVNPKIDGVAANVQIMNQHTTLSILQKFEHMIGYRSKKAYSLTNCEFVIGGVASTYRFSAIKAVGFYETDTMTEDISLSLKIVSGGNKQHRIIYGADIIAMTEPVESARALFRQRFRWKYGSLQNIVKHADLIGKNDKRYTAMLTMYRMPMAIISELGILLLPIVWGYALYLTMNEKSLLLLAGAYITVSMYMFMTLWYNEHLRLGERLYLTLYIPVSYFVFYVMDVIQLVAIIRCLGKIRGLARPHASQSSWVSPARLGGQMKVAAGADASSMIARSHE